MCFIVTFILANSMKTKCFLDTIKRYTVRERLWETQCENEWKNDYEVLENGYERVNNRLRTWVCIKWVRESEHKTVSVRKWVWEDECKKMGMREWSWLNEYEIVSSMS